MLRRLAFWLRRVADRIDDQGAPKLTGWSFTFEHKRGAVLRKDGRGCRLWFVGADEYERAHTEADTAHVRVDWRAGRAFMVGGEPARPMKGSA